MGSETDGLDPLLRRIAGDPDNWGLRRDLVGALSRAERHQEALTAGISLAEAYPRESSVWSSLGMAMQRARNWEGAEMAYRRALLLKPDDAPVAGALGQVLRESGRLEDALGYLQMARFDSAERIINTWFLRQASDV